MIFLDHVADFFADHHDRGVNIASRDRRHNTGIGYSQTWQLSVQRDLPGAFQMSASYLGGRGTRAQQQILPNTFPLGAQPPTGFTYLTSNGNSIRHAGQFQLRRRLRSGFTAQAGSLGVAGYVNEYSAVAVT